MNGSFALSLRVKERNPAPMDPLLCLFASPSLLEISIIYVIFVSSTYFFLL